MTEYNMNTSEGNILVGRIAEAGRKSMQRDGLETAYRWVKRELDKLSHGIGFSEAGDAVVFQSVLAQLENSDKKHHQ